jgi:integrase
MREEGCSFNYIKLRIAPIISFLELNDIAINRKKIAKFYPEAVKTIKDEAYTREDIQKMLQYAPFRTKAIILTYASTGIRKSALVDLKLKHLQKVDTSEGIKLYKFTIYENTKEEYTTFCTPECSAMIDQYLDKRRRDGENVTPESYLIRNDYDAARGGGASVYSITNPKPVTVGNISVLLQYFLARMKFREVNHIPKDDKGVSLKEDYKYQRQKKAIFHAFRKYFETCLEDSKVNDIIIRKLMGWKGELRGTYYRGNELTALAEYSKAINELTISDENRLRTENEIFKEKQDKLDLVMDKFLEMQQQLKETNERMDRQTKNWD